MGGGIFDDWSLDLRRDRLLVENCVVGRVLRGMVGGGGGCENLGRVESRNKCGCEG